jgi:hypothetical protein
MMPRTIAQLVGTILSFTVSMIALPLALFLVCRIQTNSQLYGLSVQVRIQIGIWTFLICNIALMTFYTVIYWLLEANNSMDLAGKWVFSFKKRNAFTLETLHNQTELLTFKAPIMK